MAESGSGSGATEQPEHGDLEGRLEAFCTLQRAIHGRSARLLRAGGEGAGESITGVELSGWAGRSSPDAGSGGGIDGLAPFRHATRSEPARRAFAALGFALDEEAGAFRFPTVAVLSQALDALEVGGLEVGFRPARSTSETPFLDPREWIDQVLRGLVPVHLAPAALSGSIDAEAATGGEGAAPDRLQAYADELVGDTVACALLHAVPRGLVRELGELFGQALAEQADPEPLSLAAIVGFYRFDLRDHCAALWRSLDDQPVEAPRQAGGSGEAGAAHRDGRSGGDAGAGGARFGEAARASAPELLRRARIRAEQVASPNQGPDLRGPVWFVVRGTGDGPIPSRAPSESVGPGPGSDAGSAGGPAGPALGADRSRSSLADCWSRLSADAPLDEGLSLHVVSSALAYLRFGLRETGILTLPPEVDLVGVREEFPRAIVLRQTAGKSESDSTFLPESEGNGAANLVLVSRDPGLGPDQVYLDAWHHDRYPDDQPHRSAYAFYGHLLGYPPCCVERFTAIFTAEDRRYNLDIFRETRGDRMGPFDPRLNHFLVGDLAPFPHYPCGYACAPSLAQADALLARIREVHRDYAAQLEALLPGLVLVFENDDYLHYEVGTPRRVDGRWRFPARALASSLFLLPGRRRRFAALLDPPFEIELSDLGSFDPANPAITIRREGQRDPLTVELTPPERFLPFYFAARPGT